MYRSTFAQSRDAVFAVGKHAGYAEFVRSSVSDPVVNALDSWIERGALVAHEQWGARWSSTFPSGAPYGLIWSSPLERACLCGVIAPSRDSVGRDYPLAIVRRFPEGHLRRAPHVVPLAYGDLLDSAYALANEARFVSMSPAMFEARLAALATPDANEMDQALAEYSSWCEGTAFAHGWGGIFSTSPIESAARAIQALDVALAPYRGREVPQSSLVLRLPLGGSGIGAAALWLDIVRRICGWSRTIPTAFWGIDAGVLIISIGPAPAGTFGDLWRPEPIWSESVLDVCNLDEFAPASARFQPTRVAVPPPTMASFLESLAFGTSQGAP